MEVPGFTIRFWLMGMTTSLKIFRSNLWARESNVIPTGPSIEFSIGTMPYVDSPFETLSITAGMVQYGIKSSPIMPATSWVKVPLGPKNEINDMLIPPKKVKKIKKEY